MASDNRHTSWSVVVRAMGCFAALVLAAPPALGQVRDQADPAAEAQARQLLVPTGESLKTTEETELTTTAPVAQGPSVVFSGEPLKLPPGETTESLAVKSGAEIMRKLGIVVPAGQRAEAGSREKDEPTTPTQLFDEEQVRRLIGDNPTVVYRVLYDDRVLPDPMIVPWIRNSVVLKDRFDEAVQLISEQKFREGKEALLAIEAEFPNSEYAAKGREIVRRLDEVAASIKPPEKRVETPKTGKAGPTPPPMEIRVDPNIKTTAIGYDSGNPRNSVVFINGESYRIGDAIRHYSDHRVVGVSEDAVTFEVEKLGQKKQITVKVIESDGTKK